MGKHGVTLISIVNAWLVQNNYDGLFNDMDGCSCEVGHLAPCDSPQVDCKPGFKDICDCGDQHDFHIISSKPGS